MRKLNNFPRLTDSSVFPLALFGVLGLFLSACNSPQNTTEKPFLNDVRLNSKADRLNDSTGKIDTLVTKPEVQLETAKINIVATELREDSKSVDELKSQNADLFKENKQLKSESEKAYQSTLSWGVRIGGMMVIVGIILSVLSLKVPVIGGMGLLLLGAGACVVSVCYGMQTNSWLVGLVGILTALGAIGFGIWVAITKYLEHKRLTTAVIDTAKTVEIVKGAARDKWEDVIKTVSKIQHPETQTLIKKIKRTQINNLVP